MQKYRDTVMDRNGNALAGVSVTVKNYPAMTAAVVYSDNGVTTTPNPLTTDAYGAFSFYAADGRYSLTFSGPRVTAFSIDDVPLLEDPDSSGAAPNTPQNFMTAAQKLDVSTGAGTLDVSAAFVAMIAAGKDCFVPGGSAYKYLIGQTIQVPSGTQIHSNGAQLKLANGVNNHMFRIANGASDVEFRGLRMDGNKDNNTGGHIITTGGPGASDIRVIECHLTRAALNGIYFSGTLTTNVNVESNLIKECGQAGISCDELLTYFSFNGNEAYLNGTHGVGIFGIAKNGTINDCVAYDNGQGNPSADNITGYNSGNDNIVVSGCTTRGGLNNGIHMGGTRIIVTGCTSYGAANYGIVMRSHDGSASADCIVSGCTSYSAGISGFWFDTCTNLAASGLSSRSNASNGYAIDNCKYSAFSGCTAYGNVHCGFKNATASNFLTFSGCIAAFNGDDGLDMTNMNDCVVTGGVYSQNTGWGISRAGTDGFNIINGDKVRANGLGQIMAQPVSTRLQGNDINISRQIASATSITLPATGEFFLITGTTNINSIAASFSERRVTLQFGDVLTVADGSNLVMAGNFTSTTDDTLTLICNGVNWIECARSVN